MVTQTEKLLIYFCTCTSIALALSDTTCIILLGIQTVFIDCPLVTTDDVDQQLKENKQAIPISF